MTIYSITRIGIGVARGDGTLVHFQTKDKNCDIATKIIVEKVGKIVTIYMGMNNVQLAIKEAIISNKNVYNKALSIVKERKD